MAQGKAEVNCAGEGDLRKDLRSSKGDHVEVVEEAPVVIEQEQAQRQESPGPRLGSAHPRLTQASVNDLFVSALHGTAADPIAQA